MASKKLRVALIFGGTSQEREVSLRTGRTIAEFLDKKKYEVYPVEISREGKWLTSSETIKQISKHRPTKKASSKELVPVEKDSHGKIDVALLALHGPGGEDGTIQGMLELLKIPYTCSGVLASALAMDKARTKRFLASFGMPVLPDVVISRNDFKKNAKKILGKVHGKVVIKPNRMGSSLGVSIVSGKSAVKKAITEAFKHDDEILAEPFVLGTEITVPVLGNKYAKALPVIEILPWKKSTFYDYKAKYEKGGSDHIIPARLTKSQEKQVKSLAEIAHNALGARGVTRSDFILDKKGHFHFLEINTIPGMTPVSLVPQSAAAAGISFTKLLDTLLKLALEK